MFKKQKIVRFVNNSDRFLRNAQLGAAKHAHTDYAVVGPAFILIPIEMSQTFSRLYFMALPFETNQSLSNMMHGGMCQSHTGNLSHNDRQTNKFKIGV